MTFQELFDRLGRIDREAASLLEEAGYYSEEGLGGSVHALGDALEDAFLREQAEDLLEPFEILHEELRYLMRPVHGAYTLEQFPNGRYGYYDEDGKEHCFTCGDSFEAKICNKYGRWAWNRVRMEHDGVDYFLRCFGDVPLCGLKVRERR